MCVCMVDMVVASMWLCIDAARYVCMYVSLCAIYKWMKPLRYIRMREECALYSHTHEGFALCTYGVIVCKLTSCKL